MARKDLPSTPSTGIPAPEARRDEGRDDHQEGQEEKHADEVKRDPPLPAISSAPPAHPVGWSHVLPHAPAVGPLHLPHRTGAAIDIELLHERVVHGDDLGRNGTVVFLATLPNFNRGLPF